MFLSLDFHGKLYFLAVISPRQKNKPKHDDTSRKRQSRRKLKKQQKKLKRQQKQQHRKINSSVNCKYRHWIENNNQNRMQGL